MRLELALLLGLAVCASAWSPPARRHAVARMRPYHRTAPNIVMKPKKKNTSKKKKAKNSTQPPQLPPPQPSVAPSLPPPVAYEATGFTTPPFPPEDAPMASASEVMYSSSRLADDELPELSPLVYDLDEPKQDLPMGPSSGPPRTPASADESSGFSSKLPSINQGRSAYEMAEKEEKPLFERLVFGLSIGGIAFLVFVEIFINTPLFQQVKPVILNMMGDGS
jgi:hypothetical protein